MTNALAYLAPGLLCPACILCDDRYYVLYCSNLKDIHGRHFKLFADSHRVMPCYVASQKGAASLLNILDGVDDF